MAFKEPYGAGFFGERAGAIPERTKKYLAELQSNRLRFGFLRTFDDNRTASMWKFFIVDLSDDWHTTNLLELERTHKERNKVVCAAYGRWMREDHIIKSNVGSILLGDLGEFGIASLEECRTVWSQELKRKTGK